MKKLKDEITCPCNPQLSTYLGKGKYKGELVYFTAIVLLPVPGSPQKVYNCAGAEIPVIDSYNIVTGGTGGCGNKRWRGCILNEALVK